MAVAMHPLAQQPLHRQGIPLSQGLAQRPEVGLATGLRRRGGDGARGHGGGCQESLRSNNGRISRNRPTASNASTPRQPLAVTSP